MAGAELVVLVGPAYSTEPLGAEAGRHLTEGMAVLVCPGSCAGAIAFKRAAGLELDDTRCVVGETSTLPYAVRVTEPGVINVFLKLTHRRVPRRPAARGNRPACYDLVKDVWPAVEKAESVFQTTLQNGNPVIHPAVTLLNTGLLERTGGDFLFYEEGVTESVGRLIEAVDEERQAIAAALGVSILSDPALGARQGYMREENYSTGYSAAPGFLGIRAQSQLDHRYLTEDVGYSLVFLADLAARLGVPTPVMEARDHDRLGRPRARLPRRGEADRQHARAGRPVARAARLALRSGQGERVRFAEVELERGEVLAQVLQRERARDRQRRPAQRRSSHGELDRVRGHAEALGGAAHAGPAVAAERVVGHEGDPLALAVVDDVVVLPVGEVVAVLHGRDRRPRRARARSARRPRRRCRRGGSRHGRRRP